MFYDFAVKYYKCQTMKHSCHLTFPLFSNEKLGYDKKAGANPQRFFNRMLTCESKSTDL